MTNKNKLGIIAIIVIIGFSITACASMSIESVDWNSLTGPARVRQYFSVSTTDVTVYAHYKDGSRKEVTFFSTSHNRESTGTQTVTVNVLGQGTGTFQTEVMELLSIRIESPPSKRTYTIGERVDLTGIKVIGSWRDMPDAEIPSYEISVSSFNSNTAGTDRSVTINYKGKTATFHVTVVAAPAAATPAPAATTPSTPTTTQPSQPATQQPASSNQFVGTWRGTMVVDGDSYTVTLVINPNLTGTLGLSTSTWTGVPFDITYTISGNTLIYRVKLEEGSIVTANDVRCTLNGNNLTVQATPTYILTRQ